MMAGVAASTAATTELLVPRSMPTTLKAAGMKYHGRVVAEEWVCGLLPNRRSLGARTMQIGILSCRSCRLSGAGSQPHLGRLRYGVPPPAAAAAGKCTQPQVPWAPATVNPLSSLGQASKQGSQRGWADSVTLASRFLRWQCAASPLNRLNTIQRWKQLHGRSEARESFT